jgi:glycosyltransferase involved in cell wall biosynthesis
MSVPLSYFVPAWLDACALYRMFMPHMHIPKSRFAFHQYETPVAELAEAEVIIVQRQASRGNLVALKQMKDMGLKIVYDLDDDLWGIPGSSPAKRIFDPIKHGFAPCMELCDVITVSTEGLKTAVKTAVPSVQKKEIVVIPNGIDFTYLHPPILPRDPKKVVVGWGGSNTHQGDVGVAFRVLPDLLSELPQLHLEFVGQDPPLSIKDHPRVRTRQYVPVGEFATRFSSWGWDIVLAPLDDNRFNRSKSNIKVLEAAAIGAPCLMSSVAPYQHFAEGNSSVTWLLCKTSNDWKTKLKMLVLDAAFREQMAEQCKSVALDRFEQSKVCEQWVQVFEGITT